MTLEERLNQTIRTVHRILQQYSEVSDKLAEAKVEYEKKEAELIEEARRGGEKLTVRQLEAKVLLQVVEEKKDYERLDARAKTLLEGLRAKRAELSALQTLAGLSREEAALARTSPET